MSASAFPEGHRLSHIERLVDVIDLPIARWDAASRLVFCNTPYLGWAERPREQLLGRTLQELFGDEAWARAEPAFREAFEGRTVNYERRLTHGSKSPRWARVQVFPDVDPQGQVEAVFTIAFDIHEDVLAREALQAASERLDRFTENIPYPLTYVDRGFVLRFVNKAYCEATGQQARGPAGPAHRRGARRQALVRACAVLRAGAEGQTVQYTRLVDRLPQGPRWLRTSYVPDFDARRHVRGLYTVTIDVHELTMAQEKLRRSVERDSLTDVLSRRTMMDRIEAAMLEAPRRAGRAVLRRPRRLQVGQRPARPRRRRPAAGGRGAARCSRRCAPTTPSAASAATSSWCWRRCATRPARRRWRCTCWPRCAR